MLRPQWSAYDAQRRFASPGDVTVAELPLCRSADVLCGRIRPPECASFGTKCTPETPLGAPMVSSEGACAAYFRYWREETA
jgi:hydrogenase expression/formation protein HypD